MTIGLDPELYADPDLSQAEIDEFENSRVWLAIRQWANEKIYKYHNKYSGPGTDANEALAWLRAIWGMQHVLGCLDTIKNNAKIQRSTGGLRKSALDEAKLMKELGEHSNGR